MRFNGRMPTQTNTDTHTSRRVHTLAQALEVLPISRSMLHREIKAGRLRSLKIGDRRLVRDEDITAYLDVLADQNAAA